MTDVVQQTEALAPGKGKTLEMIGNAHLDPVWLWQWQEGFQEVKATFRSVLELMKEDREFLFTSSSAAFYEWVARNDPVMLQEIRERVAEGRWEICGGWWIQPDCNIPGGESFVRQGLYGQRFFADVLGVTAVVGYNPDSFGHAASLPQILRKSGMNAYVFMRPHPHERHLPGRLFWWESADGSRVLTFRIPYEYCTWGKDLRQHVERCAAELLGSVDDLMCFYGVGNHGGGPTRENLASIRFLNEDPALPALRFSTPSRYFDHVREMGPALAVVLDELQIHAIGCYSAHSGIKRWNRHAENLLMTAEKACSIAHWTVDHPYPTDFSRAWKGVLFNQFHDILAGTSIEPAYDDARDLYGEAGAIASRNLNDAFQALSWRINLSPEEGARPIVVFNPHSWPVRAPVELEFARIRDEDVLLDPAGSEVHHQRLRSEATVSSGSRNRLGFVADLPAGGYRVFQLIPHGNRTPPELVSGTETSLENQWFRLEIDPETGALASLFDKRFDFEWLRAPAGVGLVLEDPSDTWSHGLVRYDRIIGWFENPSTKLVERGAVKSVVRSTARFGASTLTQDFTLYRDLARIDVGVTVDWREQFKLLKLSFPLNLFFTTATFEVPYGTLVREANGDEVAGQSWVDLTGIGRNNGNRLGLSLLNDGKYSYDVTEKVINLTVLRSPIYAHHDPYVPQPDGEYRFIDQGIQRFNYSLLPHAGDWRDAETARRAAEINVPPVPLVESSHPGPLPLAASFLSTSPSNVNATVMKRWEDGDAMIVRCLETAGIATQGRVELPFWERSIDLSFGPAEIKTLLIPRDRAVPTREINLLEWKDTVE